MSVIRVSEPAHRNAARGLGTAFARWPRLSGHCTAKHSTDREPAPRSIPDGEQRSARASVRTPALRRAAQREGVGMDTSATASSAARGLRYEHQRYRAARSASAPCNRLLGGGVGEPPGCGVGGGGGGAARGRRSERQRERRSARASVPTLTLRRAAQPEGVGPNTSATASSGRTAAGWRGEGVWGKWPPPPWPPGGGVGGSRWEGRLPPGRRVADWRGSGGKGRLTPVTKTAPHSSVLRTENKVFSLSKSSRFSQPGRSFSLSSTLCISTTAAVR